MMFYDKKEDLLTEIRNELRKLNANFDLRGLNQCLQYADFKATLRIVLLQFAMKFHELHDPENAINEKPTALRDYENEAIEQICRYIRTHYTEDL